MSDSESNDRSGGMEPPVAEAKRYEDGMTLVAELRAKVSEYRVTAFETSRNCRLKGFKEAAAHLDGARTAFDIILADIDALNGCDAETQARHGSRSTEPSS
jgi:hypothetical protein